jgi:hypothetical protein
MEADQCIALSWGGVTVADWVRNTVMLTVLAVWAAFVLVAIARGEVSDIPAIVWGLPAAVYFALNPTLKRGGKDGPA